jgi:large repetitive protein
MNGHIHHQPRPASLTTPRTLMALLLPLVIAAVRPDAAHAASLTVSVDDAYLLEGNDDIQFAEVIVTLSHPANKPVSVNYRTADGTATTGSDYDAVSGTVTFAKGETSKTILVPVRANRIPEPDRYFLVKLSNPKGAKISNGVGYVTIWDDEPRISITSLATFEGDSGTTPFTITVSMWPEYDEEVTVHYATADDTAIAGIDYVGTSGMLIFAPGATTTMITVEVIGNAEPEPDKTFLVNLIDASANAFVDLASTTVVIADDDGYYYDDDWYDSGYDWWDWYGWYYYGYW